MTDTERQSISSVEIRTSTRGTDVAVKVYAGSPLENIGDVALAEYARLMARIEQAQIDGWAKTVQALRAA